MNKKSLVRDLIIFITGFSLYVTIEILFRNESYRLSGLMGGICLLFLAQINNEISWDLSLMYQAILGGLFITFVELVVGDFSVNILHIVMWDYSNMPFNYHGLICLPFSIAWCFLAIVGIFVSDAIDYYVFGYEPQPYYRKLNGEIMFKFPKRP